jgi:hypothetical protein
MHFRHQHYGGIYISRYHTYAIQSRYLYLQADILHRCQQLPFTEIHPGNKRKNRTEKNSATTKSYDRTPRTVIRLQQGPRNRRPGKSSGSFSQP